jgi:hypothetical protein
VYKWRPRRAAAASRESEEEKHRRPPLPTGTAPGTAPPPWSRPPQVIFCILWRYALSPFPHLRAPQLWHVRQLLRVSVSVIARRVICGDLVCGGAALIHHHQARFLSHFRMFLSGAVLKSCSLYVATALLRITLVGIWIRLNQNRCQAIVPGILQ